MSRIQAPGEDKSIANLARKVVPTLSALSAEKDTNVDTEVTEASPFTFENEIERFEIWMAQHGVEQGKLDHGLRETSILRRRVLDLLEELCGLKLRVECGSDASFAKKQEDTGNAFFQRSSLSTKLMLSPNPQHGDASSNAGYTSSSLDTDISFPDSLPETTLTRIHDIITSLLGLAPALVDPAPHDRLEHFAHPDAGTYDFEHVRAKFPKAAEDLALRLGKANWERRQCLRKLRLDHEKNPAHTHALENAGELPEVDELSLPGSIPSEPVSEDESEDDLSDVPEDLVSNYAVGSIMSDDQSLTNMTNLTSKVSDFNFSYEGTRSTAATEASGGFTPANVNNEQAAARYTVPLPLRPNHGLSGEGFLCPYCFHFLLNIKSFSEWRSHVFEDIKPYMCTYSNCSLAGKTYGNKSSWWDHEKDRHRTERSWQCRPCESRGHESVFQTETDFDAHIMQQHPTPLSQTQLQNIRGLCLKDDKLIPPPTECPLCRETILHNANSGTKSVERAIRKHIADHLEQLAFFVAFPAGELTSKDDESEFQDDSDSDDDFRSEIKSIVSKDTHLSKRDVHMAYVERFIANQRNFEGTFVEGAHAFQPGPDTDSTNLGERGPSSGQPAKPISKSPTFPIRLLMHPPNEHFYARQALLAQAEQVFSAPGSICIFQGVGGVGKTLAAVQYIYTHQEGYDAIFWLQADTAPGRSDCYHQMALVLGLIDGSEDHNQIMDKGRTWLQKTEKRWLLVFDNAIFWHEISEFLPNEFKRSNGSILITSQTDEFLRPSENVTKLRLDTLTQTAGSEMLLRYLGRDVRTDLERHLAQEVSAFVGGLPVAIAHVAGYLEYSEYTLQELLETFRQWRRRNGMATDERDDLPLSFREASFRYEEALKMVWDITLRELTADSSNVINVLAYLNCEAIPEKMLWGVHEDPALHFLDAREELRHKRVKTSLTRRRLVQTKVVDGESCISMHRSLQRGLREDLALDKGKQQRVFDQAVALVREVFPRSNPLQQPSPTHWAEVQRLLPHLHALRDVYYKFSPHIKGSIDLAQLLTDAGMDQFERGITKEGLLLLKTAEEVLDAGSPEDHDVMRANIHAMIAIMYDNTGITQRQEAFDRRRTALSIRRKIFNETPTPQGKDEILLYNSEMEYAISLLHYHRFKEAEPIIEKCLQKYLQWGPESAIPFEYAKYYNKIALVRLYQGQFDEAIRLGSQSVALMEKTGYTLFESRFKFDLACIILQSGDIDRALEVHKEILNQRQEKLGQTNELTLHSIYAIAAIYEIQGKYELAETWFRRTLDQRRGVISWSDEAFSRAQFHMSKVLFAIGRPEDADYAQSLREKALRVLDRLLPLDTPPELKDVTDETILFDHMLPISPGGTRFTGQSLLPYFMKKV